MKTLKNKLLLALVVAFMLTLGAAIIPTVGMQVNAAETDSVQITLTDGIAVKYYATLGADVTEATATFESETTALNATVKGEKVGNKWLFVYNEVTPQYVDKTFSIAVNGEVREENYSVLTYLNTIINGEYAQAEKTVAKDLVYYGEAAKAYKFGGTVAATPGTAYNGESKINLGTKFADDTQIYSATVVFDTLPAITFGFKKASETATVTVDGNDVTNELAQGEDGVYTYTLTGIYAIDFDKQYNVVLTDGENTQTLLYSINDYAARMLSSANEAMKTLAKALYCYGAGAQALKTYQETYVVVTEPTYTETGVAKNGKGETVELPILNDTNYNFTQVAADGTKYKYNNGQGGKAYFAHKTYSEIVIEKEITADTITFNYKDYNNVDIHWNVAKNYSSKITGVYIDGTYVMTLTENVEATNISMLNNDFKPSVLINGSGELKITTGYGIGLNNLTVDNVKFITPGGGFTVNTFTVKGQNANVEAGAAITAKNYVIDGASHTVDGNLSGTSLTVSGKGALTINGSVTVAKLLLVESGATLNITASGDTVKVADDGVLKLYGTVNITSKTKGKDTAICLWNNASIMVSSDSRVTVTDYEYAFGKWADNGTKEDGTPVGRKGNLYIPSTSAVSGKCIKKEEVNLVDASTCTTFYTTWSINLIKVTEGYSVITKPTPTSEGLASDPKKGDYVLPKLNFTDYEVGIGGSKLTFVHDVTGVIIELPITENANLKIDGVAIDYASATGYKFTVDEGKTAELTGNISGTSITISGKGTLSLTGSVTVTKLLLVESGATFNATGVNSDTVNIIGDAVARLYGTVVVKGVADKTGIKLEKATSALYLNDTSRVTVSGGITIGHFTSSAKVYYPAGATVANNKITSANGNTLLSYGAICKIEFVAES